VAPGEKALRPFRPEEFPANKKRHHLAAEDLRQAQIVDPGNLMEDAGRVRPALRHQEMEMRVEIDAVPKGLDDGDNPRLERRPGRSLQKMRGKTMPQRVTACMASRYEETI